MCVRERESEQERERERMEKKRETLSLLCISCIERRKEEESLVIKPTYINIYISYIYI